MEGLRFRNIELETELRLVKEQLSQAQSGTQYLVNCLTNQQSGQYHRQTQRKESRLHYLEADNARLKSRLAIAQGTADGVAPKSGHSTLQRSRPLGWTFNQYESPSECSATTNLCHEDVFNHDLLTFGDDEDSQPSAGWSSHSNNPSSSKMPFSSLIDSPAVTPITPYSPHRSKHWTSSPARDAKPIGLGISGTSPVTTNSHVAYNALNKTTTISPSDEISEQRSGEMGQWTAFQPPPSPSTELVFSARFLDAEHNRLLGAASFIEDMTDVEQEEHWEKLATEKDRHSAREWQLYYEAMVRPVFLAKLAASDESVEVLSVDGEGEDSTTTEQNELGFVHDDKAWVQPGLAASKWAPKVEEVSREPGNVADEPTIRPVAPMGKAVVCSQTARETHDLVTDHYTRTINSSCVSPGVQNLGELTQARTEAIGIPTSAFSNPSSSEPNHNNEQLRESVQVATTPPHDRTRGTIDVCNGDSASSAQPSPVRRHSPREFNFRQEPCILYKFESTDDNLFHTVLITNIPLKISLADVLSIVRGGKIVSATFLETACMKTRPPMSGNAAMIVFLGAQNAKRYVEFCQQYPVHLSDGSNTPLHISLLRTPSRPMHPRLVNDMREYGVSRVLFVIDAEHQWTPEGVVQEMVNCYRDLKRPIKAGRDDDGVLVVEFADVRDSADAWLTVERNTWFFHGASKGFLPDPCARSLQSLEDLGPSVSMGRMDMRQEMSDESDGTSTVMDTPAASFCNNGSDEEIANEMVACDGKPEEQIDTQYDVNCA